MMPEALEEMQVVRAAAKQLTTLTSAKATPPDMLGPVGRLQEHRFAHFTCRGIPEPGKLFDGSLGLYDDGSISLLGVARSRLP
jgi:hypothetical protein